MYTASAQQIGHAFRDKKEWKEVGTRTNNNTYLKQVHKTNTTQTYNKHIKSTNIAYYWNIGGIALERAVAKTILGSLNRFKVHQTSLLAQHVP